MKCKRYLSLIAVPVLAFGLAACDVDVEDEGELPEIDVRDGEMPEVDVRGPDFDVDTEEKTIEVPDIDVDFPEEEEDEPIAPEEPSGGAAPEPPGA